MSIEIPCESMPARSVSVMTSAAVRTTSGGIPQAARTTEIWRWMVSAGTSITQSCHAAGGWDSRALLDATAQGRELRRLRRSLFPRRPDELAHRSGPRPRAACRENSHRRRAGSGRQHRVHGPPRCDRQRRRGAGTVGARRARALGRDFVYVDGNGAMRWSLAKTSSIFAEGCGMGTGWTLDHPTTTEVGNDLVVLTYSSSGKQECKGKRSPSPVNSMSVWQKRGARWVAIAHSETPSTVSQAKP